MVKCRECKEEIDEWVVIKMDGKKRKVCQDCAERIEEEGLIAEESESVIQGMMGFKGRR